MAQPSTSQSTMYVLHMAWFHKKHLGFPSPEAATLVKKELVQGCGKRFFALVNPDRVDEPWHIRYFSTDPGLDSPGMNSQLEDIISDLTVPLRGIFRLDSATVATLANGVLSICTTERTLLLASTAEEPTIADDWFSLVDSYLHSRRQVEMAIAAEHPKTLRAPALPHQPESTASISTSPAEATPIPVAAPNPPAASGAPAAGLSRQGSLTGVTLTMANSAIRRASNAIQARRISITQSRRTSRASSTVPGSHVGEGSADAITLESVLGDSMLRSRFRMYVSSAFASENLDFYEAVEQFLRIPETDLVNQRDAAKKIVEQYVKENSPSQVNLSAGQSSSLMEAVAQSQDGEVLFCLIQCQREIQELMRRNFFFRFATMLQQERQRVQLLRTTQGCLPKTLQKSGIDAFVALMSQTARMQSDNKLVLEFVTRRIAMINWYLDMMLKPAAAAFQATVPQASTLKSSSTAIRSTMDIYEAQVKVYTEYVDEVKRDVQEPLKLLCENVDSAVQQTTKVHQPVCAGILASREKANVMGKAELISKAMIVDLSGRMAELEAGGKKKEKDLKKLQQTLEKFKKEAAGQERSRADAEVDFVMKETNSVEAFFRVMEDLESLMLYRLDTMKEIMRKLAFAEQTALTRLGLKFHTVLDDCSNMDSLRDLIALSEEVDRAATENRANATREASSAAHAAQQHAQPVEAHIEDDVPVAEAIMVSPRRRWI